MVKVGDIWVDRYEASVWSDADCTGTQYGLADDDWPASFPETGHFTVPLYACSISGEMPSAYANWFQAQAACAAAGKRLLTNAEWQQAVEGTSDPGTSDGSGGECLLTGGFDVRATGNGSACVSYWGVEDMNGNLEEWVSDWYEAGHEWAGTEFSDGAGATPWPAGFGDDRTSNINGRAYQEGYQNGLPAAGRRGGASNYTTAAGAFSVNWLEAPSSGNLMTGFRCARSN
jgi:formylglycine-generating enzyme required for sulfatase activity